MRDLFRLRIYSSFDDASYKGRIKSVGGTAVTYYGSIDDKAYRGKVKNVDRKCLHLLFFVREERIQRNNENWHSNIIQWWGQIYYQKLLAICSIT